MRMLNSTDCQPIWPQEEPGMNSAFRPLVCIIGAGPYGLAIAVHLIVRRHKFPYFRIADAAPAFSDAKIHASEMGRLRIQPARPGGP